MAIPAQVRFEIDLTQEEYELLKQFRVADEQTRAHVRSALTPGPAFGSVIQLIADAAILRQEISPDALKAITDWRNLGPELMYHSVTDEGDWSLDDE